MRSLARLGLAMSAASLAAGAPAAIGSQTIAAVRPLAVPPAQPDDHSPLPRGGWTRDGWSDDAAPPVRPRGEASSPIGSPPADPRPGPPPASQRTRAGLDEQAGPVRPAAPQADGWRRQTWDGGRGDAFRYRRGSRLRGFFASPRYVIADWGTYGFPAPGPGRDWVRYYDDAVLIDRAGFVLDAVPRIDWESPPGDRGLARDASGHGAPDPREREDQTGRARGGGGSGYAGDGAPAGPGVVTKVIVTSPPAGTTTTTTVEDSYVTYEPRRTTRSRRQRHRR